MPHTDSLTEAIKPQEPRIIGWTCPFCRKVIEMGTFNVFDEPVMEIEATEELLRAISNHVKPHAQKWRHATALLDEMRLDREIR